MNDPRKPFKKTPAIIFSEEKETLASSRAESRYDDISAGTYQISKIMSSTRTDSEYYDKMEIQEVSSWKDASLMD